MAPIANRYTSAGALRVRRLPSLIAAAIQVMALGCIVFAAGWFTLETYWPGWRARPGIQLANDPQTGPMPAPPRARPLRTSPPAAAPVEPAPPAQTQAFTPPPAAWALSDPAAPSYAPGLSSANCREAWSAGAAPIQSWEPAYRPEMDGDGDGVACEPFYPR